MRNRTKDSDKKDVNWLKIKHFRYLKGHPSEMYFKYTDTNNKTFNTLIINQGSHGRRRAFMPESLPLLYSGPISISSATYKDLLVFIQSNSQTTMQFTKHLLMMIKYKTACPTLMLMRIMNDNPHANSLVLCIVVLFGHVLVTAIFVVV